MNEKEKNDVGEAQHLFPEHPPRPKRKRRDVIPCCSEKDKVEGNPVLAVIHHLCHSKTPFTDGQVADLTGLSVLEANWSCRKAFELEWCYPAPFMAVIEGRGTAWQGNIDDRGTGRKKRNGGLSA